MAYIKIKDLSYRYPEEENCALKDIDIDIQSGEILLLCGKSGSGKSTLAKCISGAIPNFYGGTIKGEIVIENCDIRQMSHKQRAEEITMVMQDPEKQLIMNKVHREIAFGLENIGVEPKEIKRRIWESMEFTNILSLAHRDTKSLSGGEKQKVVITSAVSFMPKCIILDEPISQLDPSSAEDVISLIKKINEELGITIIIIEQRLDKWFEAADKVLILKEGNIAFCGIKSSLYQSQDKYLLSFMPTYLKLSKFLRIDDMPKNFKTARQDMNRLIFNNYNLSYEVSDEEVINVKKLGCEYGNIIALKDINICIKKGEFIGIVGANGAGKSTLLKSLMGLIKYKGSLKIFGNEVKKMNIKALAKDIGYISQNPNDYLSKDSVYDELKFTLDNYELNNDNIIDEILNELDIAHLKNKNPRDLSGGEKQRVAIASILVLKPKILLLDEPTRGLDEAAKKRLGETLKKLNHNGTTIILVTHDMEFSCEFCSRFLLMFDGEITAQGKCSEVFGNGIYYTTSINKLLRSNNKTIFTLSQAEASIEGERVQG